MFRDHVYKQLYDLFNTIPPRYPISSNPKREWEEIILLWSILFGYMVLLGLLFGTSRLTNINEPYFNSDALVRRIVLYLIPELLFPLLIVLYINNWSLSDLGFSIHYLSQQKTFLGMVIILSIGAGLLQSFILPAEKPSIFYLVLALYAPAFIEEFFHRSIIQGKLERVLHKPQFAWILGGIIFGLFHFVTDFFGDFWFILGQSYLNALLLLLGQTLGGLFFGFVYMKTKSLYPCIIAHYLANYAYVLLIML